MLAIVLMSAGMSFDVQAEETATNEAMELNDVSGGDTLNDDNAGGISLCSLDDEEDYYGTRIWKFDGTAESDDIEGSYTESC